MDIVTKTARASKAWGFLSGVVLLLLFAGPFGANAAGSPRRAEVMTQLARPRFGVVSTTVVAVLSLLLLSLALAPRAEAFVYWVSLDSNKIGRANLNGTGVDPGFTSRVNPVGVAVDADHIYWTSWGGRIGRAKLDGNGVDRKFIKASTSDPSQISRIALAVDADHIYWTDVGATGALGTGRIARANLDGTGVQESFVSGLSFPFSLAVDDAHIYWVNYADTQPGPVLTTIGRANLDGTGVDQSFIGGSMLDVAVDADHIYWAGSGSIGRANLDGTGIDRRFISRLGPFSDLAVGAGSIFWSSFASLRIGRANLNGTGVDRRFIKVPFGPADLAVDELKPPGKVTAKRTQKLRGNRIRVKVRVKAKDDLTAKARGRVTVQGRTYKTERKTRRLGAGQTKKLTLRPKRRKEELKIAKALRRCEKARASLIVKLTGRLGNSETEKLKVKLTR